MLAPGQIIDGKYRIIEQIAEGGMGAVFLGDNTRIGRKVAIKVLNASLAKHGVSVERFEQEAQLLARIGSEHIVSVLDMGDTPDGNSYMVMEYLEGETLGERLCRCSKLAIDESIAIAEQMLDGLAAAHSAGVVHRDIKPDNLFLTRRGERECVKILDFGVSKLVSEQPFSLTLNGTLVGTPAYMSPEQARGHAIDLRTDLYAVGVVLYECISGETPILGENTHELLFRVAQEDPRPLESLVPDLDAGLAAIVRKALTRDREERFQTAGEFQEALRAWREYSGVAIPRNKRTPSLLITPQAFQGMSPEVIRVPPLGPPRGPLTSSSRSTPPHSVAATVETALPPRRPTWPLFASLAILGTVGFLGFVRPRMQAGLEATSALAAAPEPSPVAAAVTAKNPEPAVPAASSAAPATPATPEAPEAPEAPVTPTKASATAAPERSRPSAARAFVAAPRRVDPPPPAQPAAPPALAEAPDVTAAPVTSAAAPPSLPGLAALPAAPTTTPAASAAPQGRVFRRDL
jgi:eukaryotic-like serine/threonine-protein kinase